MLYDSNGRSVAVDWCNMKNLVQALADPGRWEGKPDPGGDVDETVDIALWAFYVPFGTLYKKYGFQTAVTACHKGTTLTAGSQHGLSRGTVHRSLRR